MAKENTFFDVLTSVINKKEMPHKDVKKHFSSFAAQKWLSSNPMAAWTANKINSARGSFNIPNTAEYLFLKSAIKLPKTTFLKFDKKTAAVDAIVEAFASKYNCNSQLARTYICLIPFNQFKQILDSASLYNADTRDPKILKLRSYMHNLKDVYNTITSKS